MESRGRWGGTCLNVGCIPSKALLHSSHLLEQAKEDFSGHGEVVEGTVHLDLPMMIASKKKAVTGSPGA